MFGNRKKAVDGVDKLSKVTFFEGFSPEELQRAKVQLLSQLVYRRDSFFAQAMEIGELESSGLSFRDADRIPERLKAVTAEQVRSVAEKYLGDDGLTVAILDPQPLPRTGSAHDAPGAPQ